MILLKITANLLILLPLLAAIYTYYPLLLLYTMPTNISASSNSDPQISIPKINAQAQIIVNVDPWDKNSYESALQLGVALDKNLSLPGHSGVSFLFAHSSQPPWKMTHQNTSFLRLHELQPGDQINIRLQQQFQYQVTGTKIVSPNHTEWLYQLHKYTLEKNESVLVLQTCYPPGLSLERLIIIAKRIV